MGNSVRTDAVPAPSTTVTTQKEGEAPKTTVKTETKPQSYYDSSTGRETEIMDNLNKFYNEGITDQNQIRKMSGYDTADQRKKDIIDAFSQARTVSGQEGWFNELASGRSVFNPANLQNPDYRIARQRFESARSFASMSDSDLAA